MKVSARGEYGVRMMVDLARHYGQGPLSLTEIAGHQGMPLAFLERIIPDLRMAGLVLARRGRRGGYELSRPPEQIKMSDVLRALEGSLAPMICIPEEADADTDGDLCVHQNYCTTRVLWLRVRDSIVQALDSTALADLVPGAAAPLTPVALPVVEMTPNPVCDCRVVAAADERRAAAR